MNRCLIFAVLIVSSTAFANPRLVIDFDIAGRAAYEDPSLAPQSRYTLSRAQTGLSLFTDKTMSGHLRLQAIRSAPENGYIGLEGESFVTRTLEAYARLQWQLGNTHTAVSAGLIPNTWVLSGNESFGYRSVAPIAAEALGAVFRSDTGLMLSTTYEKAARVHVSSTSGEGFTHRERNDDKNLNVHLDISPLQFAGYGLISTLRMELLYQHGTQGLMSTAANRLGARVSGGAEWLYGGVEWMQVDGLADDPGYTPQQFSAWVRTNLYGPFVALARGEQTNHNLDISHALESSVTVALGIDHQSVELHGRWQILAGLTQTKRDANARPLAGERLLSETQSIWLMVGIQSQWQSINGKEPR